MEIWEWNRGIGLGFFLIDIIDSILVSRGRSDLVIGPGGVRVPAQQSGIKLGIISPLSLFSLGFLLCLITSS